MQTMGRAMLLLLAVLACTAAEDAPAEMDRKEVAETGELSADLEGVLTEILDDVEELNDEVSHRLHGRGSAAQRARGNTVYHVFSQAVTYAQARQHCSSIGGNIADIKTMELQKFIEDLIKGVDASKSYWMGLNDETVESVWTWADGTAISGCDFSYWAPGEPNDGGGKQDCGQLWAYAGFKWDDATCDEQKYFICQVGPGEANACLGSLGSCLKLDLPSGSVTGAGRPYNAQSGPEAVVDGRSGYYWNPQGLPRNHNNWWIILDLQEPYTFSGIKIENWGDTGHDVTAFKLETSDDKSTWTQVFSTSNVRPAISTPQQFTGFYGTARYWRFTATRTAHGWQPWLRELTFCGVAGRPNHEAVTVPTAGIAAAGNAVPPNGPEKVLDGNPGTFWNPQGKPQGFNNWWIIFDFQKVHTLSAIEITNFGDNSHDVKGFKLEASDDKVTWKPVYSTVSVRPRTSQPQMFGGFSGTGRYWRFTVILTPNGWQPWLRGLKFYTIKGAGGEGEVQGDRTHTHFHVMGMMATVAEAQAYCQNQQSGQLADVKSQAILTFILQTINQVGPNSDYWIGLRDATRNFGWKWADGAPLASCSWKNWAPAAPGNLGGGQDCVQLSAASNFKMENDYCNKRKYFICQTGPGDTQACGGYAARELESDVQEKLLQADGEEKIYRDLENVLHELKELEDEQNLEME